MKALKQYSLENERMVHLPITIEKEDHLNLNQTSTFRFHVNLTGCGQIIATSHDLGPQNVAEVSLNFFISGRSRLLTCLQFGQIRVHGSEIR